MAGFDGEGAVTFGVVLPGATLDCTALAFGVGEGAPVLAAGKATPCPPPPPHCSVLTRSVITAAATPTEIRIPPPIPECGASPVISVR
jgi:hypothetical protein